EDVVLRHGGAVAGDEEGLLLRAAEEGPQPPLPAQEKADGVHHAGPQLVVVGLEDDELRAFVDRALEEDEEPADADVLPQRVGGERARAPDADAAAREAANGVDAARVEHVLRL